jgi:hypothetical protein
MTKHLVLSPQCGREIERGLNERFFPFDFSRIRYGTWLRVNSITSGKLSA